MSTAISSEMICVVLVFVGMDQQYVIPDNAYPCNKGDCLISNLEKRAETTTQEFNV